VESLKAQLLIANGNLFDPNFRQAVILVAEHGESGAMGIVLNRPSGAMLDDVAPPLASAFISGEELFLGGPVERDAAIILADFEDAELAGKLVLGTIGFVSGDADLDTVASGLRRMRVFAGHAGWGPGQLEAELKAESWIVETPSPDDLFTERPEELWRTLLLRRGGEYALMASMPFDPSTN
jgi:putative transcriptional regulator